MPRFPNVNERLRRVLEGVPQAGLPDRTFERGTGCWNCIHAKPALDFWTKRRQAVLAKGMDLALHAPRREDDPRVCKLREHVDQIDHAVAQGRLVTCHIGRTANGNPVGDLIADAFMCDRWTGRDGASLAKINGKIDVLPEELRYEIDGDEPLTISAFNERAQKEPS